MSLVHLTNALAVPEYSSCGYCHSVEESSRSYYLCAERLTPIHYQELIDRGWRRSGKETLYLPDNSKTCCPQYTIRLPVHVFSPSKSIKKKCNNFTKDLAISTRKDFLAGMLPWQNIPTNGTMKLSENFHIELKQKPTFSENIYQLFLKYQLEVHKDHSSRWSPNAFIRFLIDTPITRTILPHSNFWSFGTAHMEYFIDGKCVGVSVIDILPDPEYSNNSLGTISSILEISLARYLSTMAPDLRYYYMGYYIHDCPKMNYKGSYSPSYLLDLSRLAWVLLDSPRRTSLTENKRVLATAATDDELATVTPDNTKVLIHFGALQKSFLFRELRLLLPDKGLENAIKYYILRVGQKLAEEMELVVQ